MIYHIGARELKTGGNYALSPRRTTTIYNQNDRKPSRIILKDDKDLQTYKDQKLRHVTPS